MHTGSCDQQRRTLTGDCPTPRPALLITVGTVLLPKGTSSRATLLQGKARDRRRPPLWLGPERGSWPPAMSKGRGTAPEASPQPRARPDRALSRGALTLHRAWGGGGVRSPEGTQQRAQRRRPAGAPPDSTAHPAEGPLGAAPGCVCPDPPTQRGAGGRGEVPAGRDPGRGRCRGARPPPPGGDAEGHRCDLDLPGPCPELQSAPSGSGASELAAPGAFLGCPRIVKGTARSSGGGELG